MSKFAVSWFRHWLPDEKKPERAPKAAELEHPVIHKKGCFDNPYNTFDIEEDDFDSLVLDNGGMRRINFFHKKGAATLCEVCEPDLSEYDSYSIPEFYQTPATYEELLPFFDKKDGDVPDLYYMYEQCGKEEDYGVWFNYPEKKDSKLLEYDLCVAYSNGCTLGIYMLFLDDAFVGVRESSSDKSLGTVYFKDVESRDKVLSYIMTLLEEDPKEDTAKYLSDMPVPEFVDFFYSSMAEGTKVIHNNRPAELTAGMGNNYKSVKIKYLDSEENAEVDASQVIALPNINWEQYNKNKE